MMLIKMYTYLLGLVNDDEGQGMVEYALLIGLIAIVVIAALVLLGPAIRDMFMNIVNQFGGAA